MSLKNGMINHDELIKRVLFNGKGIIKERFNRLDKYPYITKYLENRFNDSDNIEETLKRIVFGIEAKPLCPYCNKPVKFIGKHSKMFTKYCSNSCRANDISKKIWQEGQHRYNLEHYGIEQNFQISKCIESRKETLTNKYGTTNLHNVPEINQKIKESIKLKIDEITKRHEESIIEHYGVGFSELISLPDIQEKINNTKRKNGTFNSSKSEDTCYKLLKSIYKDVIRQYRDKRYPFNCDFYIPSKDMFIECNFHWTHGGHPYSEEQDKEQLELWKSKNTKFYENAINTWTIRDPKKRKIANDNNLNYLIFYNFNELKTWLEI